MKALVGALNKDMALAGAFSGHYAISQSPVDSSNVHLTHSNLASSAPTLASPLLAALRICFRLTNWVFVLARFLQVDNIYTDRYGEQF